MATIAERVFRIQFHNLLRGDKKKMAICISARSAPRLKAKNYCYCAVHEYTLDSLALSFIGFSGTFCISFCHFFPRQFAQWPHAYKHCTHRNYTKAVHIHKSYLRSRTVYTRATYTQRLHTQVAHTPKSCKHN